MREAARAIVEALRAGRRIAIYGDYDVDGVMATAILHRMIATCAPDAKVRTYIPHRIEEGYGLNADALRQLRGEGIDLVVTVDCGVAAPAEARLAREIGLELVVTDHHEPKASGEIPVARAVVHPRLGAAEGFGELCGAGVAWKLAWMLAEEWWAMSPLPAGPRKTLLSLLPLAAIGTVADIVPLRGENRVIVARGLLREPLEAARAAFPGLDALFAAARVGEKVDAEQIAFRIAPRINACGRMQHANEALELLLTTSRERIDEIVALTEELNDRRRRNEREIFEQALAKLERLGFGDGGAKPRGIVLCDESWNLGVVGIVCSKLVERFACPAILLTRAHDEGYKGSGRSVTGIELHRVLEECSEHLSGFGGHGMAAGVKAKDLAQVERFAEAFTRVVDRLLPPGAEQVGVVEVDCVCTLGELDLPTVTEIERLAPFGRDNPKPRFLVQGAVVTQTRIFGKTSATVKTPPHLELVVKQGDGARDGFLRVQWWGAAAHAESFPKGSRVDLVVEAGLSTFSRLAEVEARLVDIRIAAPVAAGAFA